ncbi:MAG: hypothetical protein JWM41_255 [Gemmatimonadetes bacterium]|nr:hypothetical protein [Gemmatimonadota bacterium]
MSQLVIKFLNVGQGDSTHIVLPNGDHMLVDINLDPKSRGIDVIQYLADQLPDGEDSQRLAYFVNTHPHDDHIRGCGQLGNQFEIGEMWESGHRLDCDEGENEQYDKFIALTEDMEEDDALYQPCSSSETYAEIDGVTFHVFRPSRHVRLDKNMTAEEKKNRIHDECMVLKMSYAGRSVMITGDSHLDAWKSIIKHYDDDLLKCNVLRSSHHCSRTFFKQRCEDDEAWTEHLDVLDPDVIVVSVGSENTHDHPHDDMLDEYESRVGVDNVLRTDERFTVVLTIDDDGTMTWEMDDEDFQAEYELPEPEDDGNDDGGSGARRRGTEGALATAARIVSKTRLGDKSPTA